MRIEVLPDADQLAERTAVWIADRLWSAVAERGRAHLAVSGGSTPAAMFRSLAALPVPWGSIEVWQVDERIAPDGDADRNAGSLERDLVAPAGLDAAAVHLMPVTAADLDAAAADYERDLASACGGVIDVVHLGIGPDGHTASWPPGDPVINVDDRSVALSDVYQGRRRMTLTVPAVNRARSIVIEVLGADKAAAVAGLLEGDPVLPASHVRGDALVLADHAAAGR